MLAGQLFVLFGLDVKDETFRAAYKQLYALQLVGETVARSIRSIGEGLTELLTESAAAGTKLLGTAASMGMSTQAVQEWSYVAKQAGSNIDQFVVGISMFERNLREFAAGRGSKRFQDAMHEIGMSHVQAKAALTGPDGVNAALFQVSDAYLRMGNTANRAAINTGLFGARARGMAQDLGQGSGVLRQRIAELHELGGVVGNAELLKLKEFDNAISRIQTALHALAMQVVAGVTPVFLDLLASITAWIKENRELITDVLGDAFKVLAFVFRALFDVIAALGWMIRGVMNGDVGAIFLFSTLVGVVALLAATMITVLYPAIVIIGGAIWTAMAPLLPLILIVAGLAAAALLVIRNWDEVKGAFVDFGHQVMGLLSDLGAAFARFGSWVADGFWVVIGAIKRGLLAALDFVIAKAEWAVNKLFHILNFLPGVNIGDVTWGQHNTATPDGTGAGAPGAAVPVKRVPGAPASPSATLGTATGKSVGGPVANNVSIAPTTVNIYGVKDAKEASGHITNAIDEQNRHAVAALGGETV